MVLQYIVTLDSAFSHFHRASKKTMRQQPRHTPQRALLSGELKLEPRPEASLDKGSSASARHVAAMRKPSTGASSFKAKMDAMLRMMQSTTIVQTYTKLLQQMHAVPRLVIDGVEQEMVAVTAGDPAPSSGAFSNQLLHSVGQAGRKDARARRTAFHYGHSFRFRPAHTSMSLKEIKHLDVMICSAVCTPTRISPSALQASSWRLVAKSDDRVGLALYELDLGQWRGSALVALVWESTLEIEWLFVQSNVAELLYNIPRRPIKILPDDVDPLYGLHSYTASITLRSLDNVLWEKEFYQVRFQNDQLISSSNSKQSSLRSAVVATLLDNTGAYSCRDRAINGELGIPIATAALTCVISGAVIVDCNIWEAENNPIWCWSKTLAFTPMQHQRTDASFAMSGAGKQSTTWELRWCDPHTSNNLIIEVEKWSAKTNGLDTLVKRLNVELSIPFINNRFGTNHACAT